MSSQELAESLGPGTIIAGRYRIERQLGQGGMGHVFLVQHVHTDERLALKLLRSTVVQDQATLDRFRREARTPARIDSDHVVRVTDADVAPEIGNVPFLVMEYLRGEDLEHLSARRGPIPASEVVVFLSQVARALDKAHGLGIVHRDLKPENLFLTQREDGTPCIKVLDFGIAKITGGDVKEAGRLTTTGQIFGTPLYMSPEQAMAESSKVCAQTDVWALGLIAHKLLHGKEFWTAQTLTHLVAQIAFEPIPPPSKCGSELGPTYDEWFAKCCAREIPMRFRTASEAVSALAGALRVTDSPSMLARVPVSVQVPTSNPVDHKGMFAETSTTEAVTSPSETRPPTLDRTQLAVTSDAKPSRVPRSVGYAIGAALSILAGAIAAWKITSPPAAGGAGPAGSISAVQTSEVKGAEPVKSGDPGPTVSPAPGPSSDASGSTSGATTAPVAPTSAVKASAPGSSAIGKPNGTTPTAKPSATPSTAPTTAATATATPGPAKTVDPLDVRR